ncbi:MULTISPECIES: hypothetical protein [Kitasatospora]|uniref:Uncharacterized protein n=1 Tax=Kitasatospora setae (strain ATCC 33774 / DSM 43861 / JCM 3304 / KCC A-0304 / NBRC 14216 / KM-6054) TaxID=452652 RepID=E4N6E8_KITSK|nr:MULTISPECIES: hypothetical protein [Kitasatospora]BAJ26779.1 hypothetical protein KSE_09420 [Kitasatospora setae KM-6054]
MKWVVRWGAVTVIAVVVAGGYAFGVFDESAPGRGCRGSGDRVRGLEAAVTALGLPAGAAPDVPEQAGNGGGAGRSGPVTESGCFDDHSGIPWVYAGGAYSGPGPRERIREHYRGAAVAAGWRYEPAADEPDGGLCFTRTVDGHPSLLTVSFAGYAPDSGGYRVEAGHSADDSAARCHVPTITRY